MMASPMRRTSLSAPLRRSCSMRCSVREVSLRPRFSKGSSSRSSIDTGVRSSPWSSKIADERSNGRSSARSPSTEDVSLDGCSGASGAGGASAGAEASVVLVEAAVASAVSGFSAGISSRRGFSSSSLRTTCSSSRVESWRSWIACCSSGVMTTRWLIRCTSFIGRTSRPGRSLGPWSCWPARSRCRRRGCARRRGCRRGR